jgi:hypothetical protein
MKAMFCLAENQTVNQRPKERDSGGRTMGVELTHSTSAEKVSTSAGDKIAL